MKQKILEALKAKFEGVSESILNRMADKLAKTVTTEEAVTTSVEGVSFQHLLESYGDSRATESAASAVSNYEKKHSLKDGKAAGGEPTNEPTNDPDDKDTPAWAKALIASNKALSDKVEAMEGEKLTSSRQAQFNKIIEKLPENLRKGYTRMSLKDFSDEDFETLKTDISKEVEDLAKDLAEKGVSFGTPPASGGNPTVKEPKKDEKEAVESALKW